MKKIIEPKDVLIQVLTYYINTECKNPDDFNAVLSARFIDDEGTVEIYIEDHNDEAQKDLMN